MLSAVLHELEVIWSDSEIETVLEAHKRLLAIATEEDLPILVEALRSDRNNFWTRELIAEPIAYLDGINHLEELFDAKRKNSIEGHDNDSLAFFLSEIASSNPKNCKAELDRIITSSVEFAHRRDAEWLLQFCE